MKASMTHNKYLTPQFLEVKKLHLLPKYYLWTANRLTSFEFFNH